MSFVQRMQELIRQYPMMRGGGLLLICVGLGFLAAWFVGRRWPVPALAGAVGGVTASGLAGLLPPPLPPPPAAHAAALVLAIVVEVGLILFVLRRFGDDEQRLILGILIAVGLHFFIMIPAFGRPMGWLAVLTVINGALAWRMPRQYPRLPACVMDSLLKIGFGAWMVRATTAL